MPETSPPLTSPPDAGPAPRIWPWRIVQVVLMLAASELNKDVGNLFGAPWTHAWMLGRALPYAAVAALIWIGPVQDRVHGTLRRRLGRVGSSLLIAVIFGAIFYGLELVSWQRP